MNLFHQLWDRVFPPVQSIQPGMYHYQAPADAPAPYRLHLRINPDGSGLLIINASTVLHLNATAVEYAYHLVQNTPEDQAILEISKRYNVQREIIRRDYSDLLQRINTLIQTPDLDPVTFLDFHRQEPYSAAISAPYRLDCAVTYNLPDDTLGHAAPVDRVSRELTSEEWKTILEKAWNAGIPQVVFTGGEPTMRPDMDTLITYAEQLGMVSGLITNGFRLSETHYLHDLLQSGLDHVMILLDPNNEACWEALRDTLAEDIALTVHITLTRRDLPEFSRILGRLKEMGVANISLSAEAEDLKADLLAARQTVAEQQFHLIWDLPVPYSRLHPVALELAESGEEPETGAGTAWLYVEPDGDVLPGQGYYQTVLGNLLSDPWETIQKNVQNRKAKVY